MPKKQNIKGIKELESLAKSSEVDISADIVRLKQKLAGKTHDTAETIWRKVELARNADRPTTLDIIDNISEDFLELHGDRYYGDDPALVGGICRIGGRPYTFMGHQRGPEYEREHLAEFRYRSP
jgi:acetyl-CoA carboxylase carboxyl transferase subunit alpha